MSNDRSTRRDLEKRKDELIIELWRVIYDIAQSHDIHPQDSELLGELTNHTTIQKKFREALKEHGA